MTKRFHIYLLLMGLLLIAATACQKDYTYTLPAKTPPPAAQATSTLEAYYTPSGPATINAAYWKTANYLPVTAKDMSTSLLYGDGALNLTKTFNGLASFNKGNDPKVILKAAYDANYLYILAEWYDSTVNLSQHSWMYSGPGDPLKPSESPAGWTSQRNSDKMALAFEIANASGPNGNFATVGCQAGCHGTGNNATMTPTSGNIDFWNWSLATSSPLGYAHDMNASATGLTYDAGGSMAKRNSNGSTDRSGPAYEWDGTPQTLTLPNGSTTLLDPSFYLLNKAPMPGDAANGANIFNVTGGCLNCHGFNGAGGSDGATNSIGQNKKSRKAYKDAMDNVADMSDYWGILSPSDQEDVVTFLRGLSGTPGYVLTPPTSGTSAADVTTVTNVTPIQITNALFASTNKHQKYQVLFKRRLKTGNADDIQFDVTVSRTYPFGLALMDEDGRNHIGSAKETLTFK